MFLLKRDLFNNYCEWLFDILDKAEKRIVVSDDSYQKRVFGFLSERLFNIFVLKEIKENPNLKILRTKMAVFDKEKEKISFLQKIFSVKNDDNYKVLRLLGLKFKIKRKDYILRKEINNLSQQFESVQNNLQEQIKMLNNNLNKKMFSFWNCENYVNCNCLYDAFIRQVDSMQFYKLCVEYFSLRNIESYSNTEILIYIVAMLNVGKRHDAAKMLAIYVESYGKKDIWRYLPVAKFAKEQGITDENIEKAVFVFNKLEENRKNKLFEKLVEGKTIAVVGNGPSEIGKGKGAEIDAHDIVIRMNNYKTEGYEQDYGSKTDIWVRGAGGDDVLDYTSVSNYKACVWAVSHKNFMVHFDNLELLNRDLKNPNILIIDLPFDNLNSLKKESGITFPSTGLGFIYYMMKKCSAKQVDFYGFSFLEENFAGYATHYFNDRSEDEARQRSSCHSFNEEAEYMKKLVRG